MVLAPERARKGQSGSVLHRRTWLAELCVNRVAGKSPSREPRALSDALGLETRCSQFKARSYCAFTVRVIVVDAVRAVPPVGVLAVVPVMVTV